MYRQTSFTIADWISEHSNTSRYHTWWNKTDLQAYCKTDTTISGKLYLSSFVIAPTARGMGISKSFLTSVLHTSHAHGYNDILLKVHQDNFIAHRLYTSVGFTTKQKFNNRYEMEILR